MVEYTNIYSVDSFISEIKKGKNVKIYGQWAHFLPFPTSTSSLSFFLFSLAVFPQHQLRLLTFLQQTLESVLNCIKNKILSVFAYVKWQLASNQVDISSFLH